MDVEEESLCIEVITHHQHSNAATPSPTWRIVTAITAVISVAVAIITASITLYYKKKNLTVKISQLVLKILQLRMVMANVHIPRKIKTLMEINRMFY